MVSFRTFIGVAAVIASVHAIPTPADSAVGEEVGVSAPNGIVMSDTAERFSQTRAEAAAKTGTPSMMMGGQNYGGDNKNSYGMDNKKMDDKKMDDKKMGEKKCEGNMCGEKKCEGNMCGDKKMDDKKMGDKKCEGNMCGEKKCEGDMCGDKKMDDKKMGDKKCEGNMCGESSKTSSAEKSYETAQYGSGKSNWGNEYDSCVSQCVASYGSPPSKWTPSPTATEGSKGNGATHTVIVAPSQGVLRYVPFALNASVGDTIQFMWGGSVHTVTKGSQLELCNKTSDKAFASGPKEKGFMFTQVVNDTTPTYYYCATPGHCQKGMFGIINPPNAIGSPSSVAGMMGGMIKNSSDMAAMAAYTNEKTKGMEKARNWGGSMDMKDMPEWSNQYMAENVMYTRTFLAANPDVMGDDGRIDLGKAAGPLAIPADLKVALAAVGAASSGSPQAPAAAASAPSSSSNAAAPSSSAASAKSGAASVASSTLSVAIVAGIAAFLAL